MFSDPIIRFLARVSLFTVFVYLVPPPLIHQRIQTSHVHRPCQPTVFTSVIYLLAHTLRIVVRVSWINSFIITALDVFSPISPVYYSTKRTFNSTLSISSVSSLLVPSVSFNITVNSVFPIFRFRLTLSF